MLYTIASVCVLQLAELSFHLSFTEAKSTAEVLEEAAKASDLARENLDLITRKFASLIHRVCRSLRVKNTHVEDLKTYITHLLKSKSLATSDVLDKATTVNELFRAIRKLGLWDYLHTRLLEAVIEEYTVEDPSLPSMLQDYHQDLAAFKLSTMLDTYIDVIQPESEHSQSAVGEGLLPVREPNPVLFTGLTIKTEAKITEHSLEYIDMLGKKVAQFMSLPPMVLVLDKIARGCVCVKWRIPIEFSAQAVRAVQENKNLVVPSLGAVRITVGSEQVYCDPTEVRPTSCFANCTYTTYEFGNCCHFAPYSMCDRNHKVHVLFSLSVHVAPNIKNMRRHLLKVNRTY